jgi:hypothetical protein
MQFYFRTPDNLKYICFLGFKEHKMVHVAPATAPSNASPFQDTAQTRATAKSINNALNRFESGGSIIDIARDLTKELSNIWKLGKPENYSSNFKSDHLLN